MITQNVHGHIWGIIFAGAGLLILLAWTFHPTIAKSWGSKRLGAIFFTINVLFFVAMIGNGESGVRMHGIFPMVGTASNQGAFPSTLDVALSEDFLRYDAALHGQQLLYEPQTLPPRLHIRFEPIEELEKDGYSIDKDYPAGTQLLKVDYMERINIVVRWFGIGLGVGAVRMGYIRRLFSDYIDELLPLALYRHARTPEGQIRALDGISLKHPLAAEWIVRDLKSFEAENPESEVKSRIAQMILQLQPHVKNPHLRGLSPPIPIDLDKLPPAPRSSRRAYQED